jgi:hypothetical protein
MFRYLHGAAVAVRGSGKETEDHQGCDWFDEDAMAEGRSIAVSGMVVSNLTRRLGMLR